MNEFEDYLSDDFMSNVQDEVTYEVSPEVKSVFHKSRSVPLRLKDRVKEELNRLVEAGTITKVY